VSKIKKKIMSSINDVIADDDVNNVVNVVDVNDIDNTNHAKANDD
jgi:hypothetical protein